MTVPAKPVKPMRMLPIFQAMASSFVDTSIEEIEAQGKKISCKAGCGACCRQAVPLAEIEAYQNRRTRRKYGRAAPQRDQTKICRGVPTFSRKKLV